MYLSSYDPSNGELLGELEISSLENTKQVISLAKQTSYSWKQVPVNTRAAIIDRAFKALIPHQEELAKLLCREMGKKYDRGLSEVRGAIFSGSHYASEAARALTSGKNSHIQYRALGVCAVISPWNYPVAMAVNLLVPALVAGNTVVFKPSEETPLVAERLVAILNKELPNGVLNIVHGDGKVGNDLVESADINLVAFTGSLAVGKQIMKTASVNLKRLVMELGGNDPMIVLNDADINNAAYFAVASSFENSGQMCTSTERIYVVKEIADDFIKRVKEVAMQYQIGPWNEPTSQLGPIVSSKQLEKIIKQVEDAVDKGASVLVGGDTYQGRYFQPTVLTGLQQNMQIEQDETFGPVVAIATVDSIDEAILRANDSVYGLGAVVFGQQHAQSVAAQLDAGMIGINKGPGGTGDSPWVGAKQSGYGFHGSPDGHRLFAQVTVVE